MLNFYTDLHDTVNNPSKQGFKTFPDGNPDICQSVGYRNIRNNTVFTDKIRSQRVGHRSQSNFVSFILHNIILDNYTGPIPMSLEAESEISTF